MLTPLFLAAIDAHGAVTGAAEPGIVERFGIEPRFVIFQGISFLILAGVLYRFGIKPTIAAMESRQTKIDSGLKYAEEMQAKVAATQQETAGILKHAQGDAQKIIEDARKSAKEFLDRQTAEAAEKSAGLLAKAQQAIELEHKKMLADARVEIARLVVTTTQRVLAKELSDTERARYNDAATRELADV
jgi:F-type H+-transporting ATPase subunit b